MILDQHVSRVWSDLTPSRTPGGFNTPPSQCPALHPSGSKMVDHLMHHHSKTSAHRDRVDVFSTFSGDSGNVQDYHDFASSANKSMSKSHSMPDYNDTFNRHNIARRLVVCSDFIQSFVLFKYYFIHYILIMLLHILQIC